MTFKVAALARLLVSCNNVSYLHIAGFSMLGLARELHHPLLNMRTIYMDIPPYQSAGEVASLLDRMPNLDRVLLLPNTPSPLRPDSFIPQRLTELNLIGSNISLLSLVTSRRWTVRKATLWISADAEAQLDYVYWFPDASLSNIDTLCLMLSSPHASAVRIVTCCSALRRLEIHDMASVLSAILPNILHHCQRLSILALRFTPSATRRQLGSVCGLLMQAFPHALRELILGVPLRGYRKDINGMRLYCRARRVRFTLSPN